MGLAVSKGVTSTGSALVPAKVPSIPAAVLALCLLLGLFICELHAGPAASNGWTTTSCWTTPTGRVDDTVSSPPPRPRAWVCWKDGSVCIPHKLPGVALGLSMAHTAPAGLALEPVPQWAPCRPQLSVRRGVRSCGLQPLPPAMSSRPVPSPWVGRSGKQGGGKMTLLPEFGGPGRQELLRWPRWGPNVFKAGSCASPLHVGPEEEAQAIPYHWPQPWLHLAHQEPPRGRGLAP